ncbi:unnamed protein product [Lactuca saligna]|uniref:Dol-P-Glc:Glc(2)Man(9)GlcNAc(2)-PP-Dol alpha-1,2-glucosyltransferase n=1 Tax=Lactuca saligna TaxID=75948 RepID=A0AA35Y4J4_LACSI|nr:unnamed protein product [Lactuca saligna]
MGRITVALIVSSWVIPISILVNTIVPEPYMDEIFHVPQVQQYCVGNFKSWDPMITTPPGLYFISLAYIASLFPGILFIQPLSSFINSCSTSVLRSTNGLLAFSLLYRCSITHSSSCYVFYVSQEELHLQCFEPQFGHFASSSSVKVNSNLKRRRSGNAIHTSNHSIHGKSLHQSTGLFSEIWSILLAAWNLKFELFVSFSPFFALLLAFAAFVVWNGSIVLGAKEAHTVSPHFAQLLYYGLVSSCFMAPMHFTTTQVTILANSFWKNKPLSFPLCFFASIITFLSIHYFSIAHPYLLADNRHYPFYLWRKIINFHWSTRYLLIPLYLYSWTSIFTLLAKVEKKVWVMVYFLASATCLIPTPLIEFRYYTIPFFFLILHCRITNDRVWLLMGFIYTSINVFTMTMFLFRPFRWDHQHGIQRFIW